MLFQVLHLQARAQLRRADPARHLDVAEAVHAHCRHAREFFVPGLDGHRLDLATDLAARRQRRGHQRYRQPAHEQLPARDAAGDRAGAWRQAGAPAEGACTSRADGRDPGVGPQGGSAAAVVAATRGRDPGRLWPRQHAVA